MNKQRISDLITNEKIDSWQKGSIITIESGTGGGKSYWVKNTLYEYAKRHGQKILILVNRTRLKEQYIEELTRDKKNNRIHVKCYQSYESNLLYNKEIDFSEYEYIVCDEAQYFFTDANFNYKTDLFLSYIMHSNNITRFFMSATIGSIKQYIDEYADHETPIVEYSTPKDYSYINSLNFYSNKDTAIKIISRITQGNPDDKIIYFCKSVKNAYECYLKFEEKALFNCSDSNKEYSKFMDASKIQSFLKEERFKERVLITTTALDTGINISDSDIKHIIIEVEDTDTLIQCLGRKRVINQEDKIVLYICDFTKHVVKRRLKYAKELIEAADYFIYEGFDKWIIKYPRQLDYSKIVFDCVVNRYEKYKTKRLNFIMYCKYQSDIAFYNEILLHKDAYKDKIARLLDIEIYGDVEVEEVKTELEIYLSELTGKMLYKEEQQKLIKAFDIKKDGKLLKSIASLNSCLDELQIDYSIKSHRDYKRKLDDGNVNPNYKLNYWVIISA